MSCIIAYRGSYRQIDENPGSLRLFPFESRLDGELILRQALNLTTPAGLPTVSASALRNPASDVDRLG